MELTESHTIFDFQIRATLLERICDEQKQEIEKLKRQVRDWWEFNDRRFNGLQCSPR